MIELITIMIGIEVSSESDTGSCVDKSRCDDSGMQERLRSIGVAFGGGSHFDDLAISYTHIATIDWITGHCVHDVTEHEEVSGMGWGGRQYQEAK